MSSNRRNRSDSPSVRVGLLPMFRIRGERSAPAVRPSASSSPCSVRHRAEQSRHAHDVARGHGQLEVLINAPDASIQCLPNSFDRLAPAEVILDAPPDRLADGVAGVARRAPIVALPPMRVS